MTRRILRLIAILLEEAEPVAVPAIRRNECYIGLLTEKGEVKKKGYFRQPIEWEFDNAIFGFSNRWNVEFPKAKRAWGRITHFGLFDKQEGGTMFKKGRLNSFVGVEIEKGREVQFDAGNLHLNLE
jgi:hypothetical protein